MVLIAPRWPRNVRTHLAVSSDHAFAVQSPDPVTISMLTSSWARHHHTSCHTLIINQSIVYLNETTRVHNIYRNTGKKSKNTIKLDSLWNWILIKKNVQQQYIAATLNDLTNQSFTRPESSANTINTLKRQNCTDKNIPTKTRFSVAAPTVWNSLPSDIRDSSSTQTFRRLLKTHCFQQAFGSP